MAEVQLVKKGTAVTHRAGTSARSPECRVCGHWIKHWEKWAMRVANKCCLCGQTKTSGATIDGVHVTIAEFGNKEWIIPACKSCNSSGSDATIYDAVSAIQCQ